MEIDAQIEAILFWKGEPVTIPELMRALSATSGEIKQALAELRKRLEGRGIALVCSDNEVTLATAPEVSEVITRLRQRELSAELGKASLETLSIILYHSPASRREIEYIRGVNSTAILRTLLIRGLIERTQDERDARIVAYRPTTALLSLLGMRERDELPEFEAVQRELTQFVHNQKAKELESASESPNGYESGALHS